MKKILLSASALVVGLAANSQTIFSEDFQSNSMPAGWIITDVDGLTPATNVAWCTDAWTVRDDFADATNKVAGSISWYTPAGTSNDWMIIPNITITDPSTVLKWRSMAQDPSYPDGYEVRVSTSGTTANTTTFADVLFSTAADATSWGDHSVSLGSYNGQTINIAFRNNSNDQFVLMVDDIWAGVVPADDAGVSSITTPAFAGAGNVNITGVITNYGANTITTVDVVWTDGTNTYTDNLTGLNIVSGGTYNFTHSDQLAVTAGGSYNICAYTVLTNDGDATNDQTCAAIAGTAFNTTKVVVGEEATGTWCGWCPRGAVALEDMEAVSDFIGIAVHNSDPMTVTAYDAGIGGFISGYPSAVTDRVLVDDPSAFMTTYNTRKNEIAPADVAVTNVSVVGSTINFDVEATFAVTTSGDFRLNAVIVENNVTGTSSGYDQANYYSFQSNNIALTGAGHDWQAATNPVLAADMEYDHVGRAILGGFLGTSGSVPGSVTASSTYTQSYSYTVPAGQDINNISLVGMLHNNANNGEILNAGYSPAIVGIEDQAYNFDVNVFPNPTNDIAYIALELDEAAPVSMDIMTITGSIVKSNNYGTMSGAQSFVFNGANLEAGIYFVRITVGNQVVTKRIVLSK